MNSSHSHTRKANPLAGSKSLRAGRMEDLASGFISVLSVEAPLPRTAKSHLVLLSHLQPWSLRQMKLPRLCRPRRGLCSLRVIGSRYMTVSAKLLAAAIRIAKRCSVSLQGNASESRGAPRPHGWDGIPGRFIDLADPIQVDIARNKIL